MFGKSCPPRCDHLISGLEYAAQPTADPATNETGMSSVAFGQQLCNGRRLTVLTCRKNNTFVCPVHRMRSEQVANQWDHPMIRFASIAQLYPAPHETKCPIAGNPVPSHDSVPVHQASLHEPLRAKKDARDGPGTLRVQAATPIPQILSIDRPFPTRCPYGPSARYRSPDRSSRCRPASPATTRFSTVR